ncbi:hypothetical protein AB205_0033880 [Aquarana catesbeiana]|uniref:N-acetylneuraminate lyase n=1 Tax=Aquarana catesbeiana TaxID=8400 RepID=A0A2G9QIH9_AQUCT|nr:hypothetical protein AB205_0033880 [Aquarana catesbeiana]
MSLSVQERKRLAEEWVKHARGKMDNVIVHVGCLSLEDSKDLAAHAASCGADAISSVSPSFLKPSSQGWGLPDFKNIMSLISGIDLGPPRLPLMANWKPEHHENVRAELKRLGLM